MNLSVLRTVFDKLCGRDWLEGFDGPRRPAALPGTLSPQDARRLLAAGRSLRDQLLLGLLYGSVRLPCGISLPSCACRSPTGSSPPAAAPRPAGNRRAAHHRIPLPPRPPVSSSRIFLARDAAREHDASLRVRVIAWLALRSVRKVPVAVMVPPHGPPGSRSFPPLIG